MLCCQLLEHLATLVPELAPDSSGRDSVEPRLPEKHLAEQHHPAPEPAGPELVPPESAAVAVAEPVAVTSAKAAASVLVESGAVVAAIDDAAAETVRKCFENGLSVGDIQTEDNSAVDKPAEDNPHDHWLRYSNQRIFGNTHSPRVCCPGRPRRSA